MEQLDHALENVLPKPLILSSKNVSNVGETDDIRWLLIWLCERRTATKNRKRSANVVPHHTESRSDIHTLDLITFSVFVFGLYLDEQLYLNGCFDYIWMSILVYIPFGCYHGFNDVQCSLISPFSHCTISHLHHLHHLHIAQRASPRPQTDSLTH